MENPRSWDNFTRSRLRATRFFSLGIFVLSLSFLCCGTFPRFDQLKSPKGKGALLYILRPDQAAQSLFSFRAELYRYEGSFRDGKRSLLKEMDFDSGEYGVLELEPGFYALRCRDMDKIFLLKEGQRNFLSIQLFDRGALRLPGLYIQELSAEEALRRLLDGERMFRRE